MAGKCGCGGLESLGNRRRGVPLDLAQNWTSGGTITVNLDKAQGDVPVGMWRYLDYVDIMVTASLTTAGGGSVATQGWFELLQQVTIGHNIWGTVYGNGVTAREVRLLYWHLNGALANADPAAMGAGAGPTSADFVLRIFFAIDGLRSPRDTSMPIHTLPRSFTLGCGTPTTVGTNVTINSCTVTAYAVYRDEAEMIMPDPYEIGRLSQASANVVLPGRDMYGAIVTNATEAISVANWTSHTVFGYDPITKPHNTTIQSWNANTPFGERLTPGAARFIPIMDLPGWPGTRSVRETHGSKVSVSLNLDTGNLTPIVTVYCGRKTLGPTVSKANFLSAYPGVKFMHRKTKSKRGLAIDHGQGVPLKATAAHRIAGFVNPAGGGASIPVARTGGLPNLP
jgi:hypothetical protein